MRRIIYTSTATGPSAEEVAPAILRGARVHNGIEGVRGLLYARGDRFLQVIEGPKESIAITWARILADPRHHEVEVIADGAIDRCEFADWAMAYRDPGQPSDMLDERVRILLAGVSDEVAERFRRFGE